MNIRFGAKPAKQLQKLQKLQIHGKDHPVSVKSITPILHVTSIKDSFCWFEALGWKRGFSWNQGGMVPDRGEANEHGPATFGSVFDGKVEIFLCVGAQGSRGVIQPRFPGDDAPDGVWMAWWMESVPEVDQLYELAQKVGATVTHPPTNEPWGVREFHLRHPDGHTFRVSCGLGEENADDCE